MAGEWIPYDVCLPQKPEVLELVDATGLPVDQVVGSWVDYCQSRQSRSFRIKDATDGR